MLKDKLTNENLLIKNFYKLKRNSFKCSGFALTVIVFNNLYIIW